VDSDKAPSRELGSAKERPERHPIRSAREMSEKLSLVVLQDVPVTGLSIDEARRRTDCGASCRRSILGFGSGSGDKPVRA
jgi:hypothetical protein